MPPAQATQGVTQEAAQRVAQQRHQPCPPLRARVQQPHQGLMKALRERVQGAVWLQS